MRKKIVSIYKTKDNSVFYIKYRIKLRESKHRPKTI